MLSFTRNLSLCAASAGLLAGAASAQHGDFETAGIGYESSDFQVARYAVAEELADLDNDGDLDVAVANWWAPSQVTVMLNRGNGRYDEPVYYPLLPNMGALDITSADFDGDGYLDLAAPNSGGNWDGYKVSILHNNGDGTFAPHQVYIAGSGSYPGVVGLAAADFSGDGRVDLACANYGYLGYGDTVTLLVNDGFGGFLPGVPYPAGLGPYKLDVGDLNGDGLPDLAVGREQERISILLNTGGAFAPFVDYPGLPAPTVGVYQTIELADMDLDGDLDVLYSSSNILPSGVGAVALFRNQGDGTLAGAEPVSFTVPAGARDLAVADVTGNGWPEILGVHGVSEGWSAIPNLGPEGFGIARFYPGGDYPFAVEAGDVDADGDADALVLNRFSLSVNVYRNPGNGVFAPPASYPAGVGVFRWQDAGDIDADGDLDLACAYGFFLSSGGGITILRNQGAGTFGPPENYPSAQAARSVKLRDLNGDGLLDLLWADAEPPYHFRTRMNLGGSFGPNVQWLAGACKTFDIEAEDMDHDGDLDVFLLDSCSYATICANDGFGSFALPYYQSMCFNGEQLALEDLNGDGHMDIATTEVCVRLGNGDGTFGADNQYMNNWAPRDVMAADFDLDGDLDLATCNMATLGSNSTQSLSLLKNYGDGSFAPPVLYPSSLSPGPQGLAGGDKGDVDQDGFVDVVVSNTASNDVSFFRNRGDGTFEKHLRYGASWHATGCLLGDFTGDGALDVSVIVDSSAFGFNERVMILPGNPADCVDPQSYCTGSTNSAGGVADVGWTGSPDWFAADFELEISGALPGKPGLAFWGASGPQSTPFFGGTMCVAAPRKRLPAQAVGPTGSVTYGIPIKGAMIGTTRWYQFWYRDPTNPSGSTVALSDALEVTFCN